MRVVRFGPRWRDEGRWLDVQMGPRNEEARRNAAPHSIEWNRHWSNRASQVAVPTPQHCALDHATVNRADHYAGRTLVTFRPAAAIWRAANR
jgi:hypothetical protein